MSAWTDERISNLLDWLLCDSDLGYQSSSTLEGLRSQPRIRYQLLPNVTWRFVPGKENPTNCATRSLALENLSCHELWWKGPSWLSDLNISWPSTGFKPTPEADLEERPGKVIMIAVARENTYCELLNKYSSLTKLIQITTLCRRFLSTKSTRFVTF